MQVTTQDLSKVKKSIEEQTVVIDGMKINQNSCEQDIASIKQQLDNMKLSPHDGTLIWKITNVKEKLGQ